MKVSDVTSVSTSEHLSPEGHRNDASGAARPRAILWLSWHTLICAAIACAFVVTSAPRIFEACRGVSGPATAYHTTDYFLTPLLGTAAGSERMIHVFSALPAGSPVVVIFPNGNWSANFTAFILTYFGWPREVRLVPVSRENAKSRLDGLDRASLAAIFFCGVNPPAQMQPVIRLGKDLVIVPLENGK